MTHTKLQQWDLDIEGMHCASCATRIDAAIRALPQVRNVAVNVLAESVRVEADAGLQMSQLKDAIAAAGYALKTQVLTLSIGGMSCASCAGRVEAALLAVPGVLAAQVNLVAGLARVTCASSIDAGRLAAAVARAGYQVRANAQHGASAQQDQAELYTLILAACLSLPLLAPMLGAVVGVHFALPAAVQFLLASPVQFWIGARFYRSAWKALRARTGNMDLLVALGTTAAYGLSVYLWYAAPHAAPHLYFESATVVISMVRLGKWLETRAKRRTTAALTALQALRPEVARRRTAEGESMIPLALLHPGDEVVIHPGERIPMDGLLIEGDSHVDESMISGESMPLAKHCGDQLIGGAVNGEGLIVARATALGSASVLARIIQSVENAQASKAPIERTVDRVSAIFVPAIVLVALLTLAAWLLAGSAPSSALIHAATVLVIACPCALGLATPAAIMAGTGLAARRGILIKDVQALELLHNVKVVVFDKTGTLTAGRPRLTAHFALALDHQRLLACAAALQQGSEHPLARAVGEAAKAAAITVPALQNGKAIAGYGIAGRVNGAELVLGNEALMGLHGIVVEPLRKMAQQHESAGETLAWLGQSGSAPKLIGLLAFGDTLKPESAQVIARLRAMGIRNVLLTGDNQGSADHVAALLGMDAVHAQVLPEGKAEIVAGLRRSGQCVAMVGDGINDAPALAAADVGVAMGGGTDVAMHTAGLTLMRGDLGLLADAIDISRRTWSTIWQNLVWASAFNLIAVPLAAFGQLNPMIAGAAMALSSVAVLGNALRLGRWRPPSFHAAPASSSRSSKSSSAF